MKKIALFALLLLGSKIVGAANIYTITDARFIHDVSQGTFVVNTSTYGAIVAFQFTIQLQDTVTLNACSRSNTLPISNPLLAFPTATQIKNNIQSAITNSEMKQGLLKCVAEKNNISFITFSLVSNNVTNVIKQSITPP